MTKLSKANRIQLTFEKYGLGAVFTEELGWEAANDTHPPLVIDGQVVTPEIISMLKGFRVYVVPCDSMLSRQSMRLVDKELSALSPERMQIFQAPDEWVWHWPHRTNSGTMTFEAATTAPDIIPTYLAQRLAGLEFTVQDFRNGVTLAEVRDRVHGRFDASPVTKKFYDRFADEQRRLTEAIEGINTEDKHGYSTTLLNRLMFIYFLQKKEFLNNDPNYLENSLRSVQELRGADQYYTFYRDALLPLFFNKLNESEGQIDDPEIAKILGSVPYVNGGIFGRTELEIEHEDSLRVPDSAFERILKFFGDFNWHLDTRPTGNPNEINPEVIGYIFEQFINVVASGKKADGAYYTPHDVTAYMVAQTLVPRIIDEFGSAGLLFKQLREDPNRYIQPNLLHGWDHSRGIWNEVPDGLESIWLDDPLGWVALDDAPSESDCCLPGETWVEMFHRRERVLQLRSQILDERVSNVNDLVTANLNSQLLLTDVIDGLSDSGSVASLFWQISNISVFDPTCGSGAFLFAALEVLEDIYDHLIDRVQSVPATDEIRSIREQVKAQPSKKYFIRKHIAIRNLYGTDLMPGAIETAKLRIFLALAACLESRDELRPLPDLDFNLKVGNLVVGFRDADDVYRLGADLFTANKLFNLQPRIDSHAQVYEQFTEAVERDCSTVSELKSRLKRSEFALRDECDSIYAELSGVAKSDYERWKHASRPFHWFCEFPEIMQSGGFDVIIGNPPYVKKSDVTDYAIVGYDTDKCPDLYAVCYERSLNLLSPEGRHAFIVMLNLSFGARYSALRRVISRRGGSEWWSSYGKWPTQLFNGVRVANTILLLGPGDTCASTRHHIFGAEHRESLFQGLEYALFSRVGAETPIRGGIAEGLLRELNRMPSPSGPPGSEKIFIRPTGQYWFPVLFGAPPVLNADGEVVKEIDHSIHEIRLAEGEPRLVVGAALAGKVSYAWWSAVGDDFHCKASETVLGRKLVAAVEVTPELHQLASEVRNAGQQTAFLSKNRDWYINVRWSFARNVTDRFDRALLVGAGLLHHWRNLNIWYRQCMRATRMNFNSRFLTEGEIDSFLDW